MENYDGYRHEPSAYDGYRLAPPILREAEMEKERFVGWVEALFADTHRQPQITDQTLRVFALTPTSPTSCAKEKSRS